MRANSSVRARCCFVLATLVLLSLVGCQRTYPEHPPELSRDRDGSIDGHLLLGSPSFTAGIPGEGPLTLAEICHWLADPSNHEPLAVALPRHLRGDSVAAEIPADNPLTRAKIELGRQLYFDQRLSRSTTLACGDCHMAQFQFTSDEIANPGLRETAVAFNRIGTHEQFWDGRAESLEEQVRFPLESAVEMNTTPDEAAARIAAIEGYRLQFEAVFGKVTYENIACAIASFERTIVTGPSKWDLDQEDQGTRLSESARRGAELFFSERTQCSRCHSGPNFSDEAYHDIGLRPTPYKLKQGGEFADDTGRFRVTNDEADRFAFKTPTLRNVALTRPYMHDGRFRSLPEVIDYFCQGGDGQPNELAPLDLTLEEKRDLLAFLETLTGSLPQVEMGRLPP